MGLNEVPVHDSHVANTGSNNMIGEDGAECPAADQRDSAGEQALLPVSPNAGETHLPAISLQGIAHASSPSKKSRGKSLRKLESCFGQPCSLAYLRSTFKSSSNSSRALPSSRSR